MTDPKALRRLALILGDEQLGDPERELDPAERRQRAEESVAKNMQGEAVPSLPSIVSAPKLHQVLGVAD